MNFADTVVIGGGLYGCFVAEHIATSAPGETVSLVEEQDDILQRSSGHNQARVHNGYHYPRDLLTARRSHANCQRFADEWAEAIEPQQCALYAIARRRSHVSASQFEQFCSYADLPLRNPGPDLWHLFDAATIQKAYKVEEQTFNVSTIRTLMRARLQRAGVRLSLGTKVESISQRLNGRLALEWSRGRSSNGCMEAVRAVNSTYSQINQFSNQIGDLTYPLQNVWTRMAIVNLPVCFRGLSITVMDGPFFSIVPDPQSKAHLLSHVYYTPRQSRAASARRSLSRPFRSADEHQWFNQVIRDCARYVPKLATAKLRGFVMEHKMLPVHREKSDARPIVIASSPLAPNVLTVSGSKLDNVYDALAHVQSLLPFSEGRRLSKKVAWRG